MPQFIFGYLPQDKPKSYLQKRGHNKKGISLACGIFLWRDMLALARAILTAAKREVFEEIGLQLRYLSKLALEFIRFLIQMEF